MRAEMKIWQRAQSGQGLVEYALILVLVAVVVIVVLIATGGASKNLYSDITSTMASAGI